MRSGLLEQEQDIHQSGEYGTARLLFCGERGYMLQHVEPMDTSQSNIQTNKDFQLRQVGGMYHHCVHKLVVRNNFFTTHTATPSTYKTNLFLLALLFVCLAVSIVYAVFFFLSLLTDSVVTITYLMSFVALLNKKQIEKLT